MPKLSEKDIQLLEVRINKLLSTELKLKPDFPRRIDLTTLAYLTIGHLMGTYGQDSKLIKSSIYGELNVAQGGSGLNDQDEDNGTAPASFGSGNEIARANGYKRVDILVRTENLEVEFRKLDNTLTNPIKLNPGRYSIDFDCNRVRVRKEGSTAGTYQLIGYYTNELMTLP